MKNYSTTIRFLDILKSWIVLLDIVVEKKRRRKKIDSNLSNLHLRKSKS